MLWILLLWILAAEADVRPGEVPGVELGLGRLALFAWCDLVPETRYPVRILACLATGDSVNP